MRQDPVLIALEQQVECYQRLARLAEIQHEHVQRCRTEELLGVLTQRQGVLDEVADLEQSILPAKRRWNDYLSELGAGDRGKAQELLSSTRQLLEQITSADRDDSLVLQQRKWNVGRQLAQVNTSRDISRNYAANAAYKRPATTMDIQR